MYYSIVGQQPVLDRNMAVYIYALLFIMKKQLHAGVINDNHSSAAVMLITFTEPGQCEHKLAKDCVQENYGTQKC